MIVMPSNNTGFFVHCLARETGKIGHLYSPGAEKGPWPWLPFALDNGAFSCWNPKENTFDNERWNRTEDQWRRMLFWATANEQKPLWAIVPDRPGDAAETILRWSAFASCVEGSGIPLALAVQDGMTPDDVANLDPQPVVICVGGSTEWKWATVEMWASEFRRVHMLRVNQPGKLHYLEKLGIESCDGTGWIRGDRTQTKGLEDWARGIIRRHPHPLWPHTCRAKKDKEQMTFA